MKQIVQKFNSCGLCPYFRFESLRYDERSEAAMYGNKCEPDRCLKVHHPHGGPMPIKDRRTIPNWCPLEGK